MEKTGGLAFKVYEVTKAYPKEELYGISSQLRRSSLSIPTNIVEGYSRKGDRELSHIELKEGNDILGGKLWRFYKSISS